MAVVAVPMMVPRRVTDRDSSTAILSDCEPSVILTNTDLLESRPDLADRFQAENIAWLTVDATRDSHSEPPAHMPGASDIALLQYTSGSTSTPKGVVVSHGNILANVEMIRRRMENPARATSVNWVPLYHDMGLMMGVMQPLYLGGHLHPDGAGRLHAPPTELKAAGDTKVRCRDQQRAELRL